ncbi:MAG: type VI secretion system tube protein Hcp [Thiotrichales bacterium]
MALLSYAALNVNGTALSGDTTHATFGGVDVSADHIELAEVGFGSRATADAVTHRISTRRQILPVRLTKRIDQTTPELYQALATHARIDGDIKLFDTSPVDGSTRHRFTVTITGGRILAIESFSPDAFDPSQSVRPHYERIELAPHTITYADVVTSKAFTDDLNSAR